MNHRNEHRAWLNPKHAATEMRARVEHAIGNATDHTLPANPADLRGIPCIAMGVPGHSPGTRPDTAYIR